MMLLVRSSFFFGIFFMSTSEISSTKRWRFYVHFLLTIDSDSDYESENKIHTRHTIIIRSLIYIKCNGAELSLASLLCAVVYCSSLSD